MTPARSRKQRLKIPMEDESEKQKRTHKRFPHCFCFIAGITIFLLIVGSITFYSASAGQEKIEIREKENIGRKEHKAISLLVKELQVLTAEVNMTKLWNKLNPILIPRRPGTDNIKAVKNLIQETLHDLKGWNVEYDTFHDTTPKGPIEFSNIMASTNPSASRKLILACHYDSKDMRRDGYEFIGATDSAVPCAMMLEIARVLDVLLKEHTTKQQVGDTSSPDVSLDLIFFDGEEAFVDWTPTDSIYGARHLAKKWSNHNGRNVLNDIDLLVLLDLIGHKEAAFVNFHAHPSRWFDYAQSLEKRLKKNKLLSHKRDVFYRHGRYEYNNVEDDHIPFQKRGVPILHLISTPFPRVWHTKGDDVTALDTNRIEVITKILTVFVAEYLHLRLPPK